MNRNQPMGEVSAVIAQPPRFRGKKAALRRHTAAKLKQLQDGLLDGRSTAKADAARLRRAVGKPAGSVPEVWDITLGGIPETLLGRTDDPSYAETSVHTALALYAIHQQSRPAGMHRAGWGLGDAVRALIGHDSSGDYESSPVIRRFNAVATADSVEELSTHLRGLVTQFRAHDIPLDYEKLAGELYDFHYPDSRDRVRLTWGRELYATWTPRPERESTPGTPRQEPSSQNI